MAASSSGSVALDRRVCTAGPRNLDTGCSFTELHDVPAAPANPTSKIDLSRVRVLFQCGIDYYNTTRGQGTKVPGPGIAKYSRLTEQWRPGLWVTLPRNTPASNVEDFRTWLQASPPPNVKAAAG